MAIPRGLSAWKRPADNRLRADQAPFRAVVRGRERKLGQEIDTKPAKVQRPGGPFTMGSDEPWAYVATLAADQRSRPDARRLLFILPQDWTWWVWLVTACLLGMGLAGLPQAFLAALLLSIAQVGFFLVRERALKAFPVQLRLAYTLLLIACFFPSSYMA